MIPTLGIQESARPAPAHEVRFALPAALTPSAALSLPALSQLSVKPSHIWITAACGQRLPAQQIGSVFGRE